VRGKVRRGGKEEGVRWRRRKEVTPKSRRKMGEGGKSYVGVIGLKFGIEMLPQLRMLKH